MIDPDNAMCDDERMQEVLTIAGSDAAHCVAVIETLLAEFPGDARLHFLKGSLLIGLERFIGAHHAMARALEIAPDYHLARFQLGFFELTSGEAAAARQTWEALSALPDGHWIRQFVAGLTCLAEDRFTDCIVALRSGITANDENPALNTDMQLVIDQCEKLAGSAGRTEDTEELSATSFLLRNERRH